ncbi:hypothetical protein HN446_01830 [bacterium]|jgi:ATP:ADP antiporter, AAA family|nr:hypothetical protein [bacterium]
MGSIVSRWFGSFSGMSKDDRLQIFMMGVVFFFVVAAYTVAREFKDSVFMTIVGRTYIPDAKFASMFVLIPLILLYSKLVDKTRRYQLLCIYSTIYGVLGLVFTYFLGTNIGIVNTVQDPHRIFGWLFYFFIEGYSPFVLSVFWAFANSITSPGLAKRGYGFMIALSKLGGALTSGFAWFLLHKKFSLGATTLSDVAIHQIILGASSLLLLCVPVVTICLMKAVPGYKLHGYEAAYKFEKARGKAGEAKTGAWSGLKMFFRYPYILGIFSMLFFYELFNMVLNYQRLGIAEAVYGNNVSGITGFLFQQMFATHLIGFFISLFGTSVLLNWLGERTCLLLIPITTAILISFFLFSYSPTSIIIAYVGIRSINYAFSYPVRESLYIPTVKEMKFKSKSWIDAFGTKFAKSTGQVFNKFVQKYCMNFFFGVHAIFFSVAIGVWLVSAFLLGRRYQKAIMANEVIGEDFASKKNEPESVDNVVKAITIMGWFKSKFGR